MSWRTAVRLKKGTAPTPCSAARLSARLLKLRFWLCATLSVLPDAARVPSGSHSHGVPGGSLALVWCAPGDHDASLEVLRRLLAVERDAASARRRPAPQHLEERPRRRAKVCGRVVVQPVVEHRDVGDLQHLRHLVGLEDADRRAEQPRAVGQPHRAQLHLRSPLERLDVGARRRRRVAVRPGAKRRLRRDAGAQQRADARLAQLRRDAVAVQPEGFVGQQLEQRPQPVVARRHRRPVRRARRPAVVAPLAALDAAALLGAFSDQ